MKYFKKCIEYLFKLEHGKRFLILFLFAVPTGVAASVAMPFGVVTKWLSAFNEAPSFEEAWNFNGVVNELMAGVAVPVCFILALFFLSVMATIIARSLRVGVFKPESVFRDFNEGFIPVLHGVVVYFVEALLIKVLMTLLLALVSTSKSVWLAATLSVLIIIMAYIGFFMLVTLGILYLPFMSFNGLGAFAAFTQAAGKLSGGTYRRMSFAVLVPAAMVLVISLSVGAAGSAVASVIVESLLNAALITYLTALAFVSYYEILGLQREDYPRDFFYYKPPRRR